MGSRWASSRMAPSLFCAIFVICGCDVPASAAQDWPAFRGPDGQGHSREQNLPLEWSETRNVTWKTPLPGLGWSSPVVSGGKVWLTTAVEERGMSLRLLGFEVATGTEAINVEVFHIAASRDINPKNSWASPTPGPCCGSSGSTTNPNMAPADHRSCMAGC